MPHNEPEPTARLVMLGAGASRGVSYKEEADIESPLDRDFFDLLQRIDASGKDEPAVQSVIEQVQGLSYECWQSMERAFYTLQLRAYLKDKLGGEKRKRDERVIKDFAQCVQALLRRAHGIRVCKYHQKLFGELHEEDAILSFNYDLVPERALRRTAVARNIQFAPWLYGFDNTDDASDLPLILKLHGSSNWSIHVRREGPCQQKIVRITVRTENWDQLDESPGYRGHIGIGTDFPIFLPFWDKRIEEAPWLGLWQTAFQRLKNAGTLVVWGYSLPNTDLKARHLLELAIKRRPLQFCVIDPSEETRRRWRELLPRAHFSQYNKIEEFLASPPRWWRR